jgi:hypothetical protein
VNGFILNGFTVNGFILNGFTVNGLIGFFEGSRETIKTVHAGAGWVHPALRSRTSSPAKGGMSKEDLRVEGKGFTLPFGPETSGSKERAPGPARTFSFAMQCIIEFRQ